jgi:(E)-4-hydroxy-3-methylbut-2-enyl-diphosphate synthase
MDQEIEGTRKRATPPSRHEELEARSRKLLSAFSSSRFCIPRRKTPTVRIGNVRVGWEVPVVVQSMTNTDTADVQSPSNRLRRSLSPAPRWFASRSTTKTRGSAVPHIVEGLEKRGLRVPIIGDFHYNGHILLKKYPATARALAKYRINPGNVSIGRKDDDNFRIMVECAVENQKPVRIGVNWGSLDQSLLTRMMDENSKLAEPLARARRDDRGHDRERARVRRCRRALRPAATT